MRWTPRPLDRAQRDAALDRLVRARRGVAVGAVGLAALFAALADGATPQYNKHRRASAVARHQATAAQPARPRHHAHAAPPPHRLAAAHVVRHTVTPTGGSATPPASATPPPAGPATPTPAPAPAPAPPPQPPAAPAPVQQAPAVTSGGS